MTQAISVTSHQDQYASIFSLFTVITFPVCTYNLDILGNLVAIIVDHSETSPGVFSIQNDHKYLGQIVSLWLNSLFQNNPKV